MKHLWKIHGQDGAPRCRYCGARPNDPDTECRSSLTGGVGRTDRYAAAGVADIEEMLDDERRPPPPER